MIENPRQTDPVDDFAARENIRREILRSNTVVGIVLVIVLVLALAVVLMGARAKRAEAERTEQLWHSYLSEARALRITPTAGRCAQVLGVISNAAVIRPATTLRTEAAATLALSDLIREGEVTRVPSGSDQLELDSNLENVAYGDQQGLVHITPLHSDSILATLDGRQLGAGFNRPVQGVTFSPDGKYLAVRHAGGALAAWDLAAREPFLLAGVNWTNHSLAGMFFTPDSHTLYFCDPDRELQITAFDLVTRQRLISGVKVGAQAFRLRPEKSQLAVELVNKVNLVEYPGGTVVQTFEHPTRVFNLAWSPDGVQLAVSCEDGDVWLWDVVQGTHRVLRGHSEFCLRLRFSPDGRLLSTGSRDGTTRLWDTAAGQLVVMAEDGVGTGFSPDGKRMGFLRLPSSLGTWRLERSACFVSLHCPAASGGFMSLDLSPDGRWVVATQSKGFRVWDLETDDRETFFSVAGLNTVRIAPDGKSFFVCRTNGLERWPVDESALKNGVLACQSPIPVPLPDSVGARNIAVALDGGTAAVELSDLRFIALDLKGTNAPVIFPERWRAVNLKTAGTPTGPGRFAISPDGRWICTGYYLGPEDKPRVWDARNATVVATPAKGSSVCVFSADGKWLALSDLAAFQIFSTADWSLVKKLPRDETSFTHGAMAFVGAGGEVAVTRTRQSVQLRAADGEEKFLDLIPPSVQSVSTLRVSLDGGVLAIGSAGNDIQVWRLKNLHTELARLNLDWGPTAKPSSNATAASHPSSWSDARVLLTLGGLGFALVALLSLFTLRRHRATLEQFFTAEKRAAERSRALDSAKVELLQSQKMQALGTLAAGIAHDFNNLLSVIRMANKLIRRGKENDARLQQNAEEIEQAVLRGKGVVGSMLGYARTEHADEAATDLGAAVENTVALLTHEFLSGIKLTLELDRDTPLVPTSRAKIEQILLNLVVNASEAMQCHGDLKISVKAPAPLPKTNLVLHPAAAKKYAEIAVTDSGPGIAPEIRDRLFEPFFTTKRGGAKPGTGLGLSLVYTLAEQEQLGLAVESEPGRGATFKIFVAVPD